MLNIPIKNQQYVVLILHIKNVEGCYYYLVLLGRDRV